MYKRQLKNQAALEFECFRMLSYGYAVSIGDQLEPYGVLNPAAYQLIGKVFHQIKEREAWARPSKALVEAALVNKMAQNILEAIDALEYKPIRYDQVRTAIDKAEALNQEEYKDFSRVAAVKAVVWDKNVTEQADVDAMAKAIEALEKKPVPPGTPSGSGEPETGVPATGDASSTAVWMVFTLLGMVGGFTPVCHSVRLWQEQNTSAPE